MTNLPLIELRGANVKLGNHPILHDLNWKLEAEQHWAILGANGSGKSTFLRLISGQIWPNPHDSRVYSFEGVHTWSPLRARENVAWLSPELQNHYVRRLQDGADNEKGWELDVFSCVLTGFFDAQLLNQNPTSDQLRRAGELLVRFGLAELIERPLQTLSQGQLRRVLLVRALVKAPQVLLLDEACSGLDAASRDEFLGALQLLMQSGETTLVVVTHRSSEIPAGVENYARIADGTIQAIEVPQPVQVITPKIDTELVPAGAEEAPLIELRNVNVFIDGTPILRYLNWQWNAGQHWAILGGNGSGKSALLRLLRGALAPAYGGSIARFGSTKLRPLWEISEQIALVSPQIQARFEATLSVFDVVLSGFFNAFWVPQPPTPEQEAIAEQALERCHAAHLRERRFDQLSYGQTRRVLLARALVTKPRLVLLDEAFDGLDIHTRAELQQVVAELARSGVGFAVASHHQEDFPAFLTHCMELRAGEVIYQGRI